MYHRLSRLSIHRSNLFQRSLVRRFSNGSSSKQTIPFAALLSTTVSLTGLSYTAVNIFNAYDLWRNRREDRMEKIVAEATDYVYEVFVRELKKNGKFTNEKQEEAMKMVYQYVQDRVGYDYSDRTIKVLCEERLLYMKAKMLKDATAAQSAHNLFTHGDVNYKHHEGEQ